MLKIDTHILPESWPNLADKYGDDRFAVIVNSEGRRLSRVATKQRAALAQSQWQWPG